MITEKDVAQFLSYEKKLHDRIREVITIIHSASPINNYEESYSIDIDHDGSVEIEWTVYSNCSCCSDDEYSFFIDADVLLKSDDDKAEKDAKEKQKEIDKKLKIEADKKEKKRQDLDKLLAEKERGEF